MRRTATCVGSGEGRLFEALERRVLLSGEALPFTLYYPEGYSHDRINEFVPITNPNDAEAHFQLLARYETGERDAVIAEGSIPAGSRGGVTINRSDSPDDRLVRKDTPYALVLRSSLPVSAALSHYDFGTAIGESFTARTSTEWTFGEGYKDANWTRDFLIFYNTENEPAVVTLTAYTADGRTIVKQTTVDAQRRGGWSINDEPSIPIGVVGLRLTSNKRLVAALSHYEIITQRGFGVLGTPDGGATAGVVTAADFVDRNRGHGNDPDGFDDDTPRTRTRARS